MDDTASLQRRLALRCDVLIYQNFHIGVLIDRDHEGFVITVNGPQISASMTVLKLLGCAPPVGIQDLLVDLGPLRTVIVAGHMEIVYMAAHHTDQPWELVCVILFGLGVPAPHAAFAKSRFAAKSNKSLVKIKPKASRSCSASIDVAKHLHDSIMVDAKCITKLLNTSCPDVLISLSWLSLQKGVAKSSPRIGHWW